MQHLQAEQKFYAGLFERNPENEHITSGYDELHDLAFAPPPAGVVRSLVAERAVWPPRRRLPGD